MKIWLPYVQAETGADVSTKYLAKGLRNRDHDVVLQAFSHNYQYTPWLLKLKKPPPACDAIITNTWNGFAFSHHAIPMVTVDRLFVLDPTLNQYKSFTQRFFHNAFVKYFVRKSALAADQVVAVSEYTADVFSQQLELPRPSVILNAVDTDFFTPPVRRRRLKPSQPCRLLYVGTLSRRKGSDILAPIMRKLGEAFQLYHTGSEDAAILGKDRPTNMHALGRLSQPEVLEQYQMADLLLFPSRGEGLARAVMEALACGVPVVAGNTSSMPEAVDEHVGHLCPPDDVEAFVEAVRTIATQNYIWQGLSKAARQRAEERFGLRRLVDEFEEILTQVSAR